MSTDPSRPSPDPKIDDFVPKKANEVTENDLWDLDLGHENIPAQPESLPRTPGQLPVKRKPESNIKSKKPSDLKPKSDEVAELIVPIIHNVAETPSNVPLPATDDDDLADFRELDETQPVEKWAEVDNTPTDPIEQKALSAISVIGSLTKIEKIAITALCAVLALGAILTLIHFSSSVPTRPLVAEEIDFPVSGKIIEITAASTYWREPVTTGENADVVRRDTKLIPVLKLSLNSKSGAIRVFFRNADGIVVGDGITRTVKGEVEVTVSATAGFEDVGMHTAYRTGDGKRWIVQVFEAPSATSPREKFSKVLETKISTLIQ